MQATATEFPYLGVTPCFGFTQDVEAICTAEGVLRLAELPGATAKRAFVLCNVTLFMLLPSAGIL